VLEITGKVTADTGDFDQQHFTEFDLRSSTDAVVDMPVSTSSRTRASLIVFSESRSDQSKGASGQSTIFNI